jgi:hypothetical protein
MLAGTVRHLVAETRDTTVDSLVAGVHSSFLEHAARMPSLTAHPNRDSRLGRSPELAGGQERPIALECSRSGR